MFLVSDGIDKTLCVSTVMYFIRYYQKDLFLREGLSSILEAIYNRFWSLLFTNLKVHKLFLFLLPGPRFLVSDGNVGWKISL